MNQQRGRRFRTAKEKEEKINKLKGKGFKLNDKQIDSNMITPGTEFLQDLNNKMKELENRVRKLEIIV